jgi:hypothetical protein
LAHNNKEHRIFHNNLNGELLRGIKVPQKLIKISREGRRLPAELKGGNLKAREAAFPDKLIALIFKG